MSILAFGCAEKVNVLFYNKKHQQNQKDKVKELL